MWIDPKYRCYDPQNPPEWLDPDWWEDGPNVDHASNWVHRERLQAAADAGVRLCRDECVPGLTDVGCHEGGVLSLLPEPYRSASWGYEITDACVSHGVKLGLDIRKANVSNEFVPISPVVVCTEVLEHQAEPDEFLHRLLELGAERAVFSSPHSETPQEGCHEWNHAWAWDRVGYAELIQQNGWMIERHYDVTWSQFVIARRSTRLVIL